MVSPRPGARNMKDSEAHRETGGPSCFSPSRPELDEPLRPPPRARLAEMDLGLQQKSVLLIGAGRGLGGAAAVSLAREHARVAVVARTREDVEARARECRAAGA